MRWWEGCEGSWGDQCSQDWPDNLSRREMVGPWAPSVLLAPGAKRTSPDTSSGPAPSPSFPPNPAGRGGGLRSAGARAGGEGVRARRQRRRRVRGPGGPGRQGGGRPVAWALTVCAPALHERAMLSLNVCPFKLEFSPSLTLFDIYLSLRTCTRSLVQAEVKDLKELPGRRGLRQGLPDLRRAPSPAS